MPTLVGRETTTSGQANVASLVHTFTGTVSVDELLVVIGHMAANGAGGETDTVPSGYDDITLASGSPASNDWEEHLYCKVATGAETTVTIAQSSGTSPMMCVVYRFALGAGEAWGDVADVIADNTADSTIGDMELFLFEDLTASGDYVGVSYSLLTGRDTDDTVEGSYSYDGAWTDVFPGSGTTTVLSYGVTSNDLDAAKETAIWDGYDLAVTAVGDESFTWVTTQSGDNFEAMWARFFFPIVAVELREVNHHEAYHNQLRSVGFNHLPFDLNDLGI